MAPPPDLTSAYALETPEDNRQLYADWADTYDSDFVQAHGYRLPQLVAESYVANGGGWPCLDVGCGTGAVAAHLPQGAVVDGLDLSPEMLRVAAGKHLYRTLVQADLTQDLALADAAYEGMISAGTFTHGHVGGEALAELVRVLRPGALAVLSIKPEIFESHGFRDVMDALMSDSLITAPAHRDVAIYAPGRAPDGHDGDIGWLTTFRRR